MTAAHDTGLPPAARILGSWSWHPLMFALQPALALWAANVAEATPAEVWPALWLPAAVALGMWLVLSVAAWSPRRGAIVSSAATVVALNAGAGGLRLNLVIVIVALWFAAVMVVLLRRLPARPLTYVTAMTNVLATVMVLLPLPGIISQWGPGSGTRVATTQVQAGLAGRDIWYIIPDRYPRLDTLEGIYNFDNTPFVSLLEERGFQVAENSLANYPKTAHSLAATWNFAPIDELVPDPPADDGDWQPLYRLLRDHALGRTLTEAGYEYTHLGTWWSPTSRADSADRVLRADTDSEFISVFRTQTVLPVSSSDDDGGTPSLRERNRRYSSYQLDELDHLVTEPHDQPQFIMAHITLPHGPYVFEPDGSRVTAAEEDARTEYENFLNHLRYLNSRLTSLIERLTSGPESTWPVIVIQSDEGPNPPARRDPSFDYTTATDQELGQKLRTMSAILLPDSDVVLPEDLTGINTWRLVLDAVIGTHFGMVEDPVKVFPGEDHLYTLVDVRDRVQ